jgi:hypothetical protein
MVRGRRWDLGRRAAAARRWRGAGEWEGGGGEHAPDAGGVFSFFCLVTVYPSFFVKFELEQLAYHFLVAHSIPRSPP